MKNRLLQWKRCYERVSLGVYSATNNLSSPSAQQPIKLTNLLFLSFPTPVASTSFHTSQPMSTQKQYSHYLLKERQLGPKYSGEKLLTKKYEFKSEKIESWNLPTFVLL